MILEVFEKLLRLALSRSSFISSRRDDEEYKKLIRLGRELPDDLLPGRLVMKLSSEERKVLSDLKALDINDRQK